MSNLRLMCREWYRNNPSSAHGYDVGELLSLQDRLTRCLANDSDLEQAEIWLIEANDENGDTLDEVLLWSRRRP